MCIYCGPTMLSNFLKRNFFSRNKHLSLYLFLLRMCFCPLYTSQRTTKKGSVAPPSPKTLDRDIYVGWAYVQFWLRQQQRLGITSKSQINNEDVPPAPPLLWGPVDAFLKSNACQLWDDSLFHINNLERDCGPITAMSRLFTGLRRFSAVRCLWIFVVRGISVVIC